MVLCDVGWRGSGYGTNKQSRLDYMLVGLFMAFVLTSHLAHDERSPRRRLRMAMESNHELRDQAIISQRHMATDEKRLEQQKLEAIIHREYYPQLHTLSKLLEKDKEGEEASTRSGGTQKRPAETRRKHTLAQGNVGGLLKIRNCQIVSTKNGVPTGKWYDLEHCILNEETGNYTVLMAKNEVNSACCCKPKSCTESWELRAKYGEMSPPFTSKGNILYSISEAWRPEFKPFTTFKQLRLPKVLRRRGRGREEEEEKEEEEEEGGEEKQEDGRS
eukprot:jgi/Bigna1/131249/aug1.13_g5957